MRKYCIGTFSLSCKIDALIFVRKLCLSVLTLSDCLSKINLQIFISFDAENILAAIVELACHKEYGQCAKYLCSFFR